MNVLDENISRIQCQLLRHWRIPVRHIGYEIGRKGMKDDEIIPFLLTLQRPTFFTLDWDYLKRHISIGNEQGFARYGKWPACHF